LQTDLKELESAIEKLSEVGDFVVYDLLVVKVVIGLEVDPRIRHE